MEHDHTQPWARPTALPPGAPVSATGPTLEGVPTDSRRMYVCDPGGGSQLSLLGRLAADPDLRLRTLGWVLLVGWAGGLILNLAHGAAALSGWTTPDLRPGMTVAIYLWCGTAASLLGIACGAALLLSAGRVGASPRSRGAVALAVAVGNAYLLSGFDALGTLTQTSPGIPLVTAWVMFFPLVLPVGLRPSVWGMLFSAASAPIGFAALVWAGYSDAQPVSILLWTSPTFIAAGIMIVPLRITHRLTSEAEKARVFGSYRLVERLGEGGMGEVWSAEHRLLARPAAIKIIRTGRLGVDPDLRALTLGRFRQEAQAIAELQSPHTVGLYDFGVNGAGAPYLVMELLAGMDLSTLVQRHGPLPAARVVHLLRHACRSLGEAHHRGLIHRDIKPSNLWVGPFAGEPDFLKVLDFGLVKSLGGRETGEQLVLTQDGAINGTPTFLPPEVARGASSIDGRADLYALGCVAWYLLTGAHVFERPTAMGHILAHLEAAPDAAELRRRGVPGPLEAVVLECLAKAPDERAEGAEQLELRLGAVAASCGLAWSRSDARAWWDALGEGRQRLPAA